MINPDLYILHKNSDKNTFSTMKVANMKEYHSGDVKIKFGELYFSKTTTLDFKYNFNTKSDTSIKTIADVESITIATTYKQSNKLKIKNIKDDISNIISKRTNEINDLKNDRNKINDRIENEDLSEEEINNLKEDVELIADQIRNHNKEIKNIKESVQTTEFEIGDELTKYSFTLYRNNIVHISGLPGQRMVFSIMWIDENYKQVSEPIETIIENSKKIKLTYNELFDKF